LSGGAESRRTADVGRRNFGARLQFGGLTWVPAGGVAEETGNPIIRKRRLETDFRSRGSGVTSCRLAAPCSKWFKPKLWRSSGRRRGEGAFRRRAKLPRGPEAAMGRGSRPPNGLKSISTTPSLTTGFPPSETWLPSLIGGALYRVRIPARTDLSCSSLRQPHPGAGQPTPENWSTPRVTKGVGGTQRGTQDRDRKRRG
jgi:hypothetical protein